MARLVVEEGHIENVLFKEMSTESDCDSSEDEIIPFEDGEPQVSLFGRCIRRPKPTDIIKWAT